jgi:hypothetical protein
LHRQGAYVDTSYGVYYQWDKRYEHQERPRHNERSYYYERCSGERGHDTPDRSRIELSSARNLPVD